MTTAGALAPAPRRTLDTAWLLRATAISALILLRVVALVVVLDSTDGYKKTSAFAFDTARYHEIAEQPGVPYVDFEVEYPPGSLALLEVVHGPTREDTMREVGIAMLVLDFVTAAGVAYGWGRRAAVAYLALGLPLMFPPFIYFRVDLLSVALAVWGFALVKRRGQLAGGALLGVAVLAKFWPLALFPALLVRRQWRAATTMVATLAAGGLAWLAWTGTDGPRQVLTFRGAEGWNVESLVGGFYRIIDGGIIFKETGAIRTGEVPGWASPLLGLVLVATIAALWWRASRVRMPADGIVEGVVPVAAICAFLVCSPVLSPQYVVWLLPFGAICWVRSQRPMAWLVAAIVVLTMVLTKTYAGFVDAETGTYAVLTARNLLLVATTVVGFVTIEAQSTGGSADPATMETDLGRSPRGAINRPWSDPRVHP